MNISLSALFAPENLVSRDGFGSPVLRQPAHLQTRSTIGGWRRCNNFVPVLGGDSTKIAPTGDIFGQPPGQMR